MEQLVEDHAYRHGLRDGLPVLAFSAGGNAEVKAGRPSAGRNNTMLRHVLKHLSRDAPDVFPSNEPDDYPMLNAAATAESESLTKRSEAKDTEIVNPENLKRVRRYVADRQVVAFGKKAQLACARAGSDVVARGRHLSFTNINRRITVPFQGEAATEERARIVAAEILGSIASSKASVPAEPLRFEKVGRSSA